MSLTVTPELVAAAQNGQVDDAAFIDCIAYLRLPLRLSAVRSVAGSRAVALGPAGLGRQRVVRAARRETGAGEQLREGSTSIRAERLEGASDCDGRLCAMRTATARLARRRSRDQS